jgi:hypothetical protein
MARLAVVIGHGTLTQCRIGDWRNTRELNPENAVCVSSRPAGCWAGKKKKKQKKWFSIIVRSVAAAQ